MISNKLKYIRLVMLIIIMTHLFLKCIYKMFFSYYVPLQFISVALTNSDHRVNAETIFTYYVKTRSVQKIKHF